MRFPSAKIDFDTDVGVTGQDHDNYPAPSSQARFDHLRLAIIALLTQQASYSTPTQYRVGSPWFDLNTSTLKIFKNNVDQWVSLSETILIDSELTLAQWYESVKDTLVGLSPEVVFSGRSTADDVINISIPQSVQESIATDARVFLHINGLLVDPRNCSLIGTPPTTIRLSNISLSNGDTFTVSIRKISSTTFLTSTVIVP